MEMHGWISLVQCTVDTTSSYCTEKFMGRVGHQSCVVRPWAMEACSDGAGACEKGLEALADEVDAMVSMFDGATLYPTHAITLLRCGAEAVSACCSGGCSGGSGGSDGGLLAEFQCMRCVDLCLGGVEVAGGLVLSLQMSLPLDYPAKDGSVYPQVQVAAATRTGGGENEPFTRKQLDAMTSCAQDAMRVCCRENSGECCIWLLIESLGDDDHAACAAMGVASGAKNGCTGGGSGSTGAGSHEPSGAVQAVPGGGGGGSSGIHLLLVKIDHMNDQGNYCKRLRAIGQQASLGGLRIAFRVGTSRKTGNPRYVGVLVAAWGAPAALAAFNKSFKTTYMDHDGGGHKCLERKSRVVSHGTYGGDEGALAAHGAAERFYMEEYKECDAGALWDVLGAWGVVFPKDSFVASTLHMHPSSSSTCSSVAAI